MPRCEAPSSFSLFIRIGEGGSPLLGRHPPSSVKPSRPRRGDTPSPEDEKANGRARSSFLIFPLHPHRRRRFAAPWGSHPQAPSHLIGNRQPTPFRAHTPDKVRQSQTAATEAQKDLPSHRIPESPPPPLAPHAGVLRVGEGPPRPDRAPRAAPHEPRRPASFAASQPVPPA